MIQMQVNECVRCTQVNNHFFIITANVRLLDMSGYLHLEMKFKKKIRVCRVGCVSLCLCNLHSSRVYYVQL